MTIRIVIIGAGILGLTAGILLKNKKISGQNVEITIIEKRLSLEHIGGGLSIWPNGSKVLLNLPCAKEIQQLAGDLKEEYWSDAQGHTLRVVDRDLFKKINGSPFMNICRSELQQVLLNNLGNKKVIYGSKLVKIEQTAKNATVYFDNREPICADLVIGADGTFSTVRKFIFPDIRVQYTGYIALVGLCRFSEDKKPTHHIIFGQNRQLLVFPVSQNRYMIYTVRPYPQKCIDILSKEQQIALFKGWSTEVDRILDNLLSHLNDPKFAAHYFCNENFDMPQLPMLHQNKVVLVGDAAHRIGSIMGLGTNIGLEDVDTLLKQLISRKDISSALEHYSRIRISRVKPMIALETDKKEFLMKATAETFSEFKKSAQSTAHDEFFEPVVSALCSPKNLTKTSIFRRSSSSSDALNVKQLTYFDGIRSKL